MYHSVTIGDKNSFDDWHLVQTERILVSPPSVRTNYADIPGMHGTLDLSEVLTGYPVFGNREGTWEFYVLNSYDLDDQYYGEWYNRYSDIMQYLHGRIRQVVLEDDPGYYYQGRLTVADWTSEDTWSHIKIDYKLDPFKYELADSTEDWLWDPFSFESGVIREYGDIAVDGSTSLTFTSSPRGGTPEFYASADDMSVTIDGTTYNLTKEEWVSFASLVLPSSYDEIEMAFTGTGTVSVRYRGGLL